MSSKPVLQIGWATHAAAKHAVEKWHYSHSLPVPPLVKVGAWENGEFIGVVIFSRGASSNLLKPYGLEQTEGCELTRIALSKHSAPVSRIVKLALIFLKKRCNPLRLVVSFADPQQNHHGGIYQAGNWVYSGVTAKSKEYIFNGKKFHSRQVSEKGYNIQNGEITKTVKPSECKVIITEGKHRYLMPLDEEMKKQIAPLAKPYPRRGKQAIAPYQGDSGGAAPTATLQ